MEEEAELEMGDQSGGGEGEMGAKAGGADVAHIASNYLRDGA